MRIIFSIRSLLLTLGVLAISAASFAQFGVGVSITIAPPICPCMSSRYAQGTIISGSPVTGLMLMTITIGCRAPG